MTAHDNEAKDPRKMLLPQTLKHLSYVRRYPGAPPTIEPVLQYLAKVAPEVKKLSVRYRARFSGPWKLGDRLEPNVSATPSSCHPIDA